MAFRLIASPGSGALFSPRFLAAFLSCFFPSSDLGFSSGLEGSPPGPPICTGVAAPRFVAGAIAATWLAYRMYVPALAARAPLGHTYVATGTGDARIVRMMSRME